MTNFVISLLLILFSPPGKSVELPDGCIQSKIYPCAFSVKKPSLVKIKSNEFHLSEETSIRIVSEDYLEIISGGMWFQLSSEQKIKMFKTEARLQGKGLLVYNSPESLTLYQFDQASSVESQKIQIQVLSGQMIQITSSRASVPSAIGHQRSYFPLAGFSPVVGERVKNFDRSTWTKSEDTAEVYREVANSIEFEKDQARIQRVEAKRQKDLSDQKYKNLFRKRYFSPESWSEFLQNPDFSP